MAEESNKTARILIVDDHPIVRQGMQQMIGHHPDLEVCGVAESQDEALQQIPRCHPDLVLVDITLKDSHGIELIKAVKARHPNVKMLVISAHDENLFAERALNAGAMGYLSKQEATENLIDGIRSVLRNEVWLSGAMTRRLLRRRVGGQAENTGEPADLLTDRELEVFQFIGQGRTTREIAAELQLSPKTIERYRENIKAKLGLSNGTELIRRATMWVLEGG